MRNYSTGKRKVREGIGKEKTRIWRRVAARLPFSGPRRKRWSTVVKAEGRWIVRKEMDKAVDDNVTRSC